MTLRPHILLALVLPLIGWGGPAFGESPDQKKAEAQLRALRSEIERVRAQVGRDAIEQDRLSRELRAAERSVAGAREELERLRTERADRQARRAQIADQQREREAALDRERSALGGQMRAAHVIGREEPLKLLLNQRDPSRAGRMFAYYSYFGRARAEQIGRISEHVEALAELDQALAAEEAQLAALEGAQRKELEKLEGARRERGRVLASLKQESRSRARSLSRMQSEQAGLEKLLRELRRAVLQRFPVDGKGTFAALRGKLHWPVDGRLTARFGQQRASGLKWDGVLLATERGAPVRAVHGGRVVYADWLAGLGLLVIVDHGDSYLSLYGYNDRIYKSAGDRVTAGEAIAAAGDSGGRTRPELYFEIRKGAKPVDPGPWFRNSRPNAP